jgi:hypothetical protein
MVLGHLFIDWKIGVFWLIESFLNLKESLWSEKCIGKEIYSFFSIKKFKTEKKQITNLFYCFLIFFTNTHYQETNYKNRKYSEKLLSCNRKWWKTLSYSFNIGRYSSNGKFSILWFWIRKSKFSWKLYEYRLVFFVIFQK